MKAKRKELDQDLYKRKQKLEKQVNILEFVAKVKSQKIETLKHRKKELVYNIFVHLQKI